MRYMETIGNKKNEKIEPTYYCEKCHYKCFYHSDWSRHLSTRKHSVSHAWKQMETNGNKKLICGGHLFTALSYFSLIKFTLSVNSSGKINASAVVVSVISI